MLKQFLNLIFETGREKKISFVKNQQLQVLSGEFLSIEDEIESSSGGCDCHLNPLSSDRLQIISHSGPSNEGMDLDFKMGSDGLSNERGLKSKFSRVGENETLTF